MPILSAIGRRSPGVRALVSLIYLLLLAGAATMVYPFLLMLAGSTKSAVDTADTRVVPRFLTDDTALYRKYIEGLFNEKLDMLRYAYGRDISSFRVVEPPPAVRPRLVAEWNDFLRQAALPPSAYELGFMHCGISRSTIPSALRRFKQGLIRRFDGDIAEMNRALHVNFVNWNAVYVLPRDFLVRRGKPVQTGFSDAYHAFKAGQPPAARYYFSAEGFYKGGFLQSQYTDDLSAYNRAHGTGYASWDAIHLDRHYPAGPGRTPLEQADWESFVRGILNLLWVRADPGAAPAYRAFLRAKYSTIDALNRLYGTHYEFFEAVSLPGDPAHRGRFALPSDADAASGDLPVSNDSRRAGLLLTDWDAFVQGWKDPDTGTLHQLPVDKIRVESLDFRFRDFLKAKYKTVAAANRALGTGSASWLDFLPPQAEMHYLAFQQQKGALRREFLFRNYASVVDYMVLHGRGILNTTIYCLLAILAALIVNPLAAYALSRYRPPSAYKILLFLMLTMSFPPMVTQIPVFLMLRQFHLLNTFWALILPGLANGYMIFLLKGFFDSLPRELYECAALDGAGEFRIFWRITMSLSTPILAVVALQAFTVAYANFMMAMLICQDEKMWTLMPWLYQLQQRSGQGVIYASLILAALPTFVVFAFCQNVIMRGIVVPVEK